MRRHSGTSNRHSGRSKRAVGEDVEPRQRSAFEHPRLWERCDVRGHSRGRETFHHPDVGDITLGYQGMELTGTPGQHLITYYAEPGTAEYDVLVLLDHLGAEEATVIPAGQDRS